MSVAIGSYVGGYEILELIGRGGMGEVYKAQHPRLPRADAIKLLNSTYGSDDDTRARFEREADLVAPLSHPNLVNVLDRGTHDGQLWIAMEFVPGTDAAQMLTGGPLHPRLAVTIIAKVADGLDYAHRKGLVHRDVKPGNILITPGSDPMNPDTVKLTDFGIARMAQETDSSLTSVGMTVGTLRYSAPEQVGGEDIDHHADVYALGCSLYELLTATAPFDAPTSQGLMAAHMFNPPPNPAAVNPAVPAAMAAVISKAMAKKPADRFDSGRELAEAAQEALKGGGAQVSTRAQHTFAPVPANVTPPQSSPSHTGHRGPLPATAAVTFPPQSNPYQSNPYQSNPSHSGTGTGYQGGQTVGGHSSPSSPQMSSGQYPNHTQSTTPPPAGPPGAGFVPYGATSGGPEKKSPWYSRAAVMAGPIVAVAVVIGVVVGLLVFGGGDALATPGQPDAEVGESTVDISWPAVDGASEYVLREGETVVYVGSEPTYSQPVPLPGVYTYSVSARSGEDEASPFGPASGEVVVTQRWHGVEHLAETFSDIVGPSPLSTDTFTKEACWGGVGSVETEIPKTGTILCRSTADAYSVRFREFPSKQARDDYLNSLGLKTTQVTTDQGATGLLYQGEGPNSEWAGTLIFAFDDPDLETYDVAVSMDNGKDADAAAVIDELPL
jgi:serine/threonine protein kinase